MVVVRWPGNCEALMSTKKQLKTANKTRGAMGFACRFACPDERSGTRGFFFLGTCPAELREAKKTNKTLSEGTNINKKTILN
jgi:hypothetical protein